MQSFSGNQRPDLLTSKVHNPSRLPLKTTSERPKVLRTHQFFTLLTSKCASRHNGVHFFDIATSKSGPELRCFVHFDFEACFALNGVHFFDIATIATSKSGNMVCLAHYEFEMCFAPQRRTLFRHLNFQKWSGLLVFFNMLTPKCASRHNDVHV